MNWLLNLAFSGLLFLSLGVSPAQTQERLELPGRDRPLQANLADLFYVGALDGADWETFSRISAVAFDRDGNLVVLDRGEQRVVKVDGTGELLARIGGAGDGPGEFGTPTGLAVTPEGRIVVFDIRKRGFALFKPDGTFERTVPIQGGHSALPGAGMTPHPSGGVVSTGMMLTMMTRGGIETTGDSSTRPLYRYSLEDGSWETIFKGWRPDGSGPPEVTPRSGGRAIVYAGSGEKVFEAGLHFGVLPDGSLAVVDSVTYSVKVVGEDGALRRTLLRPIEPREVTRDDQERERVRRAEALQEGGSGTLAISGSGSVSRGAPSPEVSKSIADNLQFADEIPVVKGMAVDWEGRIWVERWGRDGEEAGPIDILTSDGQYLGTLDPSTIRIPDAFGPDGMVAFVEKDDLDVPRVEVKRLILGFS